MKKKPQLLKLNSKALYTALMLLLFNLGSIQQIEAQAITCPPDATVECGDPIDPTALGFATAASGGAVTFLDISVPGCPNTATIDRVWSTLIPTFPFVATCTQMITIEDTTPPMITCAASQTTPVECPGVPVFVPPTAMDDCDPAPPSNLCSYNRSSRHYSSNNYLCSTNNSD